jgi:hypothetical protein
MARIWSIHPKYLDSRRLTAQWREALLCRAVINGKTKGYVNHPQVLRIKNHPQAYYFINAFLYQILEESRKRGFNFDNNIIRKELSEKLGIEGIEKMLNEPLQEMEVTEGQVEYEFNLLQKKLGEFHQQYALNEQMLYEEGEIEVNSCFIKVPGDIMNFEKIK